MSPLEAFEREQDLEEEAERVHALVESMSDKEFEALEVCAASPAGDLSRDHRRPRAA